MLKPNGDTCECEDFAPTAKPCMHIHAAHLAREGDHGGECVQFDTEVVPTGPTYKQVWPAYNLAQATEKRRVQVLLNDLC